MNYLQELILKEIKSESTRTTGCTDPGSVALAVATARRELSGPADRITVTVSPNIFKNGVNVGVPGTKQRGLSIAAALGNFVNNVNQDLSVLDSVSDEVIHKAEMFVKKGGVTFCQEDTAEPLYIKAELHKGCSEKSSAIIMGDYTEVVFLSRGNSTVFQKSANPTEAENGELINYPLKEIYEAACTLEPNELQFLIDYAEINMEASKRGLKADGLQLGKFLQGNKHSDSIPIYKISNYAQTMTAAAGEARMSGMVIPIMALSGSGNHGITNFVGTYSIATELGASRDTICRALAISSIITIYGKLYLHRMTAFCGCAVAAATGVAAATVYMLGGNFEQAVSAMHSVIGTIGGMFCDGAKESCAYKLSTAVAMAVQFSYMAVNGIGVSPGVGIVGNTIEDTFYNLGQLNKHNRFTPIGETYLQQGGIVRNLKRQIQVFECLYHVFDLCNIARAITEEHAALTFSHHLTNFFVIQQRIHRVWKILNLWNKTVESIKPA